MQTIHFKAYDYKSISSKIFPINAVSCFGSFKIIPFKPHLLKDLKLTYNQK